MHHRALRLALLLMASCSLANSDSTSGAFNANPSESGDEGGAPSDSMSEEGSNPQPGTLTAGAWDDNLNFAYYQQYLATVEHAGLEGLPIVPRQDRLVIEVVDAAGAPLAGAEVAVRDEGGERFRAPTGADGRVLFFPSWEGASSGAQLEVTAQVTGGASTTAVTHAGDSDVRLQLAGASTAAVLALDVAIVLDTTGSMGDELEYLKVEVASIAEALTQGFPGIDARWALVVYRDEGDVYVTRSYPFGDVAALQSALASNCALDGGDYPEAPEEGLMQALQLQWRGGATARVIFHVADAPHHPGHEGRLLEAVRGARAQGIRFYPVAASGVDELAEFTMRSEAQLTGGRYLFLTDDSGVGGEHKEPTLPCYFVTRLDHAMIRMLTMELTGQYREPDPAEVIRTGGDPQDRRCTLAGGVVVMAL